MLNKFLILFLFASYQLQAFSNENENCFDFLDDSIVIDICAFLDLDESNDFGLSEKRIKSLFAPHRASGKHLRNISKFGITTTDGSKYFLEEFLILQDVKAVSKLNGSEDRSQGNLDALLKGLLKKIPHTPLGVRYKLGTFHKRALKIYTFFESPHDYETSSEKLSILLAELVIWGQISERVRHNIQAEVKAQVEAKVRAVSHSLIATHIWAHAWPEASKQIRTHVDGQMGTFVRREIGDQVRSQLIPEVWIKLMSEINTEIESLFKSKIDQDLSAKMKGDLPNFQFGSAYQDGKLNEILVLAINYAYALYQIGSISFKLSEEFTFIHKKLELIISEKISEEEATSILDILNIPETPDGSGLIEAPLQVLKKLLP